MLSIRTIIWVTLVIFLLPADDKGKEALLGKINTGVDYAHTASDYAFQSAAYLGRVCTKLEFCNQIDPSWETFTRKAQNGVDLIGELINEHKNDRRQNASTQGFVQYHPTSAFKTEVKSQPESKSTLIISDLIPVWQGPQHEKIASR